MGDFEAWILVHVESSVKYHSVILYALNPMRKTHEEQYLAGSFSGALSSQKVTEEFIKVS